MLLEIKYVQYSPSREFGTSICPHHLPYLRTYTFYEGEESEIWCHVAPIGMAHLNGSPRVPYMMEVIYYDPLKVNIMDATFIVITCLILRRVYRKEVFSMTLVVHQIVL